jgi:rRNA maturation protein Nop10
MKGVVALALAVLVVASGSVAWMQNRAAEEETAWVCPMHPDYTMDGSGSCPRCGMALVRAAPFDVRDYRLDFRTDPPVIKPGQKATFHFAVFHPGTGQLVQRFESVHERQYHLFVISQDMEYFQHIHPVQQADGTWSIDVTLPKAGYYKVLSDFLPGGGAVQFLARPLVTAGYAGDLAADGATLVPDTVLTKTVDGLTATLSFDPPTFIAGLYGHLNFHLTDTKTGQPVSDLQTYLGAFGHTLIMSEDMADYVHSHPLDILSAGDDDNPPQFVIPPGADLEKLRGGPDVTFDGLVPRPGRYRAWTQFRRNDIVHTFSFTFEAVAGAEP